MIKKLLIFLGFLPPEQAISKHANAIIQSINHYRSSADKESIDKKHILEIIWYFDMISMRKKDEKTNPSVNLNIT